jgi:hypothetical protein
VAGGKLQVESGKLKVESKLLPSSFLLLPSQVTVGVTTIRKIESLDLTKKIRNAEMH